LKRLRRMTRRTNQTLGWTLTAAATYAAVFVLPYRFPLREPVLSDTWAAGSNNQVAAIGLALVSVAMTLVCWLRTSATPREGTEARLGRNYLAGGILAAILWTAGLGWAVARVHMYWGDEGYFLNQLRTGILFHRAVYTQFEFAYGPLLYLWPKLWIQGLSPLGVSFTAAYLVSLAILQALGLVLLFYTVQALPLGRSLKICAFALIAFGTLNSLLGLNYSIFRFILPFAAVVLFSRQRTIPAAALVAGCGEIACLATSPELGIAFGGAAIVYALYRSRRDGARWLIPALATVAGAAVFAAIAGPAYFFTLGNMAKGGFNLLLTPAPHILALLLAAVALAPLAVAKSLRTTSHGAMILAFYIAALGMLPAALGRSDPIHAFFDGIGLYLLSCVALNSAATRWRRAWIVVVALVFVFTQAKNFRLHQYWLGLVLGTNAVHEDWGFDEDALRRAIGNAQVSAPILAPQRVLDDLTRTGQYVPGYFCGWVGVWDRETETRKIAEMRRTEFALVALTDPVGPDPARDRRIRLAMLMGFAAHPRRPDHIRGALLDEELEACWIPRGRFGDYVLYQRLR
jgi:hypothetical protein